MPADRRFRLVPVDERGLDLWRSGPEDDRYARVCHECGSLVLEHMELRHAIAMHSDNP